MNLDTLPDELLLHILEYLDIPDLFATSRVGTSHGEFVSSRPAVILTFCAADITPPA